MHPYRQGRLPFFLVFPDHSSLVLDKSQSGLINHYRLPDAPDAPKPSSWAKRNNAFKVLFFLSIVEDFWIYNNNLDYRKGRTCLPT